MLYLIIENEVFMKQIGVILESFQKGFDDSLDCARSVGVDGVQVYATDGPLNPDKLSETDILDINKKVSASGLIISALCGDMGGHGFAVRAENAFKVAKSKRICDLASKLGTRVITTHIGVIPDDESCDTYSVMCDAMRELGQYAEKRDIVFAIETGPEKVSVLKRFIQNVDSRGVGVNYDPANLYMVTHEDEVAGVYELKDYIVHTHAKDGVRGEKFNPAEVYNFLAEGGIGDLKLNDYFLEVPLGVGGVRFDEYIKALDDIGYKGFLTIEREVSNTPENDIKTAVDFLRKYRK